MNTAEKLKPSIERVGWEQTPVLTLDDFDLFTAPLQAAAARAQFVPDRKTYYPGVRAPMPKEVAVAILQGVYRQLYSLYGIPPQRRLKPTGAMFSLIASAPDKLSHLQRIPHFDTSNPHFFALLLYLNPGFHGSTGFFRHKGTGFERVDESRIGTYFSVAEQFLQKQQGPSSGYVTESRDDFDLFHQVDYRQHRMVIYPGNLLHSILVDEGTDIDPNPESGRLTANLFFEFA